MYITPAECHDAIMAVKTNPTPEAGERLASIFYAIARGLASKYLKDFDDEAKDDIVQEGVATAWAKVPAGYDPSRGTSVFTYATTVILNRFRERRRKLWKRKEHPVHEDAWSQW